MKHHYSEPRKEKSLWYVDKINSETKKVLQKHEFSNERLAIGFLTQIRIWIDDKLVYSGN